jgi:hypothetical protein
MITVGVSSKKTLRLLLRLLRQRIRITAHETVRVKIRFRTALVLFFQPDLYGHADACTTFNPSIFSKQSKS